MNTYQKKFFNLKKNYQENNRLISARINIFLGNEVIILKSSKKLDELSKNLNIVFISTL